MIDRTIAPKTNKISRPTYLKPERLKLSNGLPIYGIKAGHEELLRIDFVFKAGGWYQSKALVASITNAMLQEGSKKHSSLSIAEFFDYHGAYINLQASHHQSIVSLLCLNKHVETLIPVVEEMIKQSTLPENEFQNIVDRRRERFLVESEKIKVMCQKGMAQSLFGTNHPYGLNLKSEDFNKIELSDIERYYPKMYHSNNCEIHIVGQYDDKLIASLDKYFGQNDWNGIATNNPSHEIQTNDAKSLFIEKVDSVQSAIRVGKLFVDKSHPDYFGLKILTTLLGGYFGSRLMTNIREEKGYTYGIGAGFINNLEAGYFIISTEVDAKFQNNTITEIQNELKRLQEEPIPAEELNNLKQYLSGDFLRSFDGSFQQLAVFRAIHNFGLDYTHYDQYYHTLNTIDAPELMRLAQEHLQFSSMHTCIVGNSNT